MLKKEVHIKVLGGTIFAPHSHLLRVASGPFFLVPLLKGSRKRREAPLHLYISRYNENHQPSTKRSPAPTAPNPPKTRSTVRRRLPLGLIMGPAGTITSRMGLNEKRRAEEEEGLIQPHIEERRYERIRRNGLAVFECFKAWAFANPRRLVGAQF